MIAPLASHDAEEGRNACTLLTLFASLFQLVLMAGNSINKITLFLCCMIIIGVETLADGKQGIKDVHEKDIQIKVNTLQLNEENEDCGIFFTLQSATYKKAKYVLTCKIKNSRKGETVDVEKFAKGFSVKLGEAEWNAVLLTGRKTLKYHETTEAKMLVKCKQDVSGDMTNYRLFYTTEPEEDEDQIQQFRTEYIVKK